MTESRGAGDPAADAGGTAPAHRGRGALRSIAVFEALKGTAALGASLGLLSLLHRDLHQMVAALISHFGLRPGDQYPALALRYADLVEDANRRNLVLLAAGYIALRYAEAYGLWRGRRWGEWLGALSGALYVPFELTHLLHRPTPERFAVLAANLAVVAYLAWQLSRGATAGAAGSGTG